MGSAAFEAAVARVRRAAARLVRARTIPAHPTYFEVLTAAALDHFRRARVDVAVLEVGMGGRLDATNVAEPLASAIVTVEKDHEAYLGSTLAAIAHEKAGVLRARRATVLGPLAPEARAAVEREAASAGARLVSAREGVAVKETNDGLEVRTPHFTYRGLRTLPGAHQRDNALVALRLLEEARAAGLAVNLGAAAAALAETRWPGRLERVVIEGTPPLLLDGAHNPAAAALRLDGRQGRRGDDPHPLSPGAGGGPDPGSHRSRRGAGGDRAPGGGGGPPGEGGGQSPPRPRARPAARSGRRPGGGGGQPLPGRRDHPDPQDGAPGLSTPRNQLMASGVSQRAGPTILRTIFPVPSRTNVSG